MKKYLSEGNVHVPVFFTRGMSDVDKASFEETYKATAWMLRIIRERLEDQRDDLSKASESLEEHAALLKNAAERKALRTIIEYLPESINE